MTTRERPSCSELLLSLERAHKATPLRKRAENYRETERCVGIGNTGLLNISFVSSIDAEKHHKTFLVLPTLEKENQIKNKR